ncbi:MAG: hypothetical protein WD598_01725 [Acidimicrobiia bacterium]
MELVAAFLVVGLVVAIAAVFVVREAGRLARKPPPALFDAEDAYEWIVEHVPDDVAATLTTGDVRRILDLQIEFFERHGVSPNGTTTSPDGPVVVGGAEQVAYIVERSAETGEAFIPEQVHAVVETQLAYLREIGAIGPLATPADQDEPPSPPRG